MPFHLDFVVSAIHLEILEIIFSLRETSEKMRILPHKGEDYKEDVSGNYSLKYITSEINFVQYPKILELKQTMLRLRWICLELESVAADTRCLVEDGFRILLDAFSVLLSACLSVSRARSTCITKAICLSIPSNLTVNVKP